MDKYLKNNKNILLISTIILLCVHLIKIVNYYPNWDSAYGIDMNIQGMANLGRWFSGVGKILLASTYDLQWVSGLITTIFLAISISFVLNIFEINKRSFQIVAICLFASFPSVTSIYVYSLWSPIYACSLALICLSTYLCIYYCTDKSFLIIATIAVVFSLGIYQIYILYAYALMLLFIIKEMMTPENMLEKYKGIITSFVVVTGLGAIIYFVINIILSQLFNYEMSSYQGVSEIGKMDIGGILIGMKKMVISCLYFYFFSTKLSIYSLLSCILILLIIVNIVLYVILNNKLSISRRIMICLGIIMIEFLTYSLYLVSPGVFYHSLMELGNYLIYLIPLFFVANYYKVKRHSIIVFSFLCILSFYHFVNANIAYQQMCISYEKAFFNTTEIISQIESCSSENVDSVLFVGDFYNENGLIETRPNIIGASTNSFIDSEQKFITFSKYYFGRNYRTVSKLEREKILKSIDLSKVSIFPYGNYVQISDGVAIVKLSGK